MARVLKTRSPRAAAVKASAFGNLLPEVRRSKILEWVQEEGSARVRDLADAFQVSDVTIRQDLERLEADGHISREHGGAYLQSVPSQVRAMALQHMVNMDAKRKIARAAAALVSDGETIIIDSGSTTTELAAHLSERQHLNVITNALNIALIMGALPTCTVLMPGGQFKAPTLSLTGERSAAFFDGLFAEKLFLATAAVSTEVGLTFPSMADLHVKRAMVKAATTVILLADSSKIGRTSLSWLANVDILHTLITDSAIKDADRLAFESRGVQVIVA
ncbi:DeoR/GlpR family DNA-binding transcription regulator [Asticcacaulis sp.]|uniref:DeoR/GlpR family DNA-binding transcription regulator n=1 Tax=Asticcacaulis sp. TaxID=1872648 RepID=UPI00262F79FE|nr:DeoR/GlpR family DNA-binding transcription regulator [Asticcacaulis sp.]